MGCEDICNELSEAEYQWCPGLGELEGQLVGENKKLAQFLLGGLIFAAYAKKLGGEHMMQPKRTRLFLAAALHDAQGGGRYAYAVLIGLAAAATLGVAARHLYVQSLPPDAIPSCGAPLAMLMKFMPVWQLIRKVLTGSGECGLVNWRFLGLAMPAWVALWALGLGGAGVLGNLRRAASATR